MDLKAKLPDAGQTVLLYGTTPPRLGTAPESVAAAADKLAARLAGLPLDGVVVYDIQDETGRTQHPRPFPFVGTVDPRSYSTLLQERSGRPTIVYKALGELDEPGWQGWLFESAGPACRRGGRRSGCRRPRRRNAPRVPCCDRCGAR